MGQLIDPLKGDVEILKRAVPAAPNSDVVFAIRLPALVAKRFVQVGAAFVVAIGILLVVLVSDRSDSSQEVIAAQREHIESLERVIEKVISSGAVTTNYDAAVLALCVCIGILLALALFLLAISGANRHVPF